MSEQYSPEDLALARIRVALDDIAPEIPEDEIHPQARLHEDLRLDTVSIWALAVNLEKLARIEIPDVSISSATTIDDFISIAMTSTYNDTIATSDGSSDKDDKNAPKVTNDTHNDPQADAQDAENLTAAAADLAAFFNK